MEVRFYKRIKMEDLLYYLLLTPTFFLLPLSIRALVASLSRQAGIDAVYKYTSHLIEKRMWRSNIQYYDEMLFSYYKTMMLFWRFDKMTCVKPEYYDLLKPYFEMSNNG